MKKRIIPGLCILWCCWLTAAPLAAVDVGGLLGQSAVIDDIGSGGMSGIYWSGTINPWLSGMLIGNGDIYISAALSPTYENLEFVLIPELLRSEVTLRSGSGTELRFGRTPYIDPLGLIAGGLFDGAQLSQNVGDGVLGVGAWYTGLQYKKSANITVSPRDTLNYNTNVDINDIDSYFAPRRVLTAVQYEHPALAELVRLRVAALGQFDVNHRGEKYHSEYLLGKATVPFKNMLFFDAGAALELLQIPDRDARLGLAGELGVAWLPPTLIQDRLSLAGRYATGKIDDSPLGAFMPLTTVNQGRILKAKFSGLALVEAEYTARLHRIFSVDMFATYFLKTAEGSSAVELEGGDEDKYALGGETYLRLIVSPRSDLYMNFGGGVFLPQLGDIAPRERARWLFETKMSFAIF
jgi:hypothetical protein